MARPIRIKLKRGELAQHKHCWSGFVGGKSPVEWGNARSLPRRKLQLFRERAQALQLVQQ